MKILTAAAAFSFLLAGSAVLAQEHVHAHGEEEALGQVRFPTSCRGVDAEFTRAVALLHSFGYEESRRAFEAVAAKDSSCGMASWGVAMTYYHPIWAPPTPRELALGSAAAEKAARVGAKTDRERGYISTIGVFYRDADRVGHDARASAYESALGELSRRFPDDHEATIFYALEIRATAPENDPTYAKQKRAAKILNDLLPLEPQHPGIAHYLIHAFDYPGLATEALPAARAYAKIAPSSPHALHMPSHIFTRLGLWQESIGSNIASADAARRLVAARHPGATSFDALHALDYLEYAYLQTGDAREARKVLDEAAAARQFDEPGFQAGYAISAIPARWTLEQRDWKGAASLEPSTAPLPWDGMMYARALTHYAQALGAARSAQPERARIALARLEEIEGGLRKNPLPGPYDWAAQVESMRRAAQAWAVYGAGRQEEALKLARSAADLEEKTGKHAVTPGPPLPARELLGDLLFEMGRPDEAFEEYQASLRESPNRFNSLAGAARAAEVAKKPELARPLAERLVQQCAADSRRPELAEARRILASGS